MLLVVRIMVMMMVNIKMIYAGNDVIDDDEDDNDNDDRSLG